MSESKFYTPKDLFYVPGWDWLDGEDQRFNWSEPPLVIMPLSPMRPEDSAFIQYVEETKQAIVDRFKGKRG
jgi:hypothetical protein